MKAVAHASVICRWLDDGNVPIAVVVSWHGTMQHAKRNDCSVAINLDYLVAIPSLSAVSVMHIALLSQINHIATQHCEAVIKPPILRWLEVNSSKLPGPTILGLFLGLES